MTTLHIRTKYPRTVHLPWSPGVSSDDIVKRDFTVFEDIDEVVVTEKLDGENSSMYTDGTHARSVDSRHHPSRNWLKGLHGRMGHNIPPGWRVCGENLYARHSVPYDQLESFFYVFSIWDETNTCLSWDDTIEWAGLLDLVTVPVLYRGPWSEETIRGIRVDLETTEGYVVRDAGSFHHSQFSTHLAKWVRKGHVQTDKHWMFAKIVPNQLREDLR